MLEPSQEMGQGREPEDAADAHAEVRRKECSRNDLSENEPVISASPFERFGRSSPPSRPGRHPTPLSYPLGQYGQLTPLELWSRLATSAVQPV
jgi:hypothetical protein